MAIKRISLGNIKTAIEAGSIVLVPNNRLRDAVLHAYAQSKENDVYATPRVLGIDVWVRECWDVSAQTGLSPYSETRPVSTMEEIFLWTEIIESSLDRYPLLNPEETANVVGRAYQTMKHWQLDKNHEEVLQSYDVIPDINAFLNWCQRFQVLCRERRLISLADCLHQINKDLRAGVPLPLHGNYLLLNFYQPPPLYAALFSSLELIGDVQRENRNTETRGHGNTGRAQPPARTHTEFQTRTEEFTQCAQWAKNLLETEPQTHIGLVGELDESQRNEFQHLLSTVLSPNHIIELGNSSEFFNTTHNAHSLMQEGVIHDAFLVLGLLRETQQSEDICRLLRSPFIVASEQEQPGRTQLERFMRRNFSERCQVNEVARLLAREEADYHCPQLSSALLKFRERARRLPTFNKPRAWSELFSQLLEDFQWPGSRFSQYQQRILSQWQEALLQLAALSPVLGSIEVSKAIACLRNFCARAKYSQTFDAMRPISLYSIDEAAGLEFDHLWLLNFNDQVWPPAISPSPFLPYSLQRDLGIPGSHSDIQHAMAQANFEILSRSVTGSLRSSHHRSDGDQEYRASSFASGFEYLQAKPDSEAATQGFYGRQFQQDYVLTEIEDVAAVPLQASTESLGGHQVLSDQSSCPFRAFALHRLAADPLQAFASGLSRMARGSAMHRAVECLMKEIDSDTTLNQLSDAAIQQHCAAAAAEAVKYLRQRHPSVMTPSFEQIELARYRLLLYRFLTASEAEAGRGSFTVIGTEQRLKWQQGSMHFTLVIDRIDQLADGSLAVIDYKTGKSTPSNSSWLAERPEDMQLPFYFTVMSESQPAKVKAVAIAHLNAARIGYSGLPADQSFHSKLKPTETDSYVKTPWPELTDFFTDRVKTFAAEFEEGVSRVDPVNDSATCTYCQLDSLCRIDELGESLSRRDGGED
ncbi:MAG: PD-(D/E)XK nuclease family protein [Gammaproteobacteria bacterium]